MKIPTFNTIEALKASYLDFFNNYLTVETFAEHSHLTLEQAKRLLALGEELHESQFGEYKKDKRFI